LSSALATLAGCRAVRSLALRSAMASPRNAGNAAAMLRVLRRVGHLLVCDGRCLPPPELLEELERGSLDRVA
jgi:hypothetical protein